MSVTDRVAAKAAETKPLRVLLSLVAFPFWLLGVLVGFVLVAVTWAYAAAQVGVADAKATRKPETRGDG